MKLGLIGTGKQGQRYLLEKNGGRHITATYDRKCSTVDWLWTEELDGVIIACHPAAHFEHARVCLEHGIPVLVEKPLALRLGDCERLLDLAARKNVPLEVAHTHLWSPRWEKTMGDILLRRVRARMKQTFKHASAPSIGKVTVRWTPSEHDYDPWLDWGPHALALLEDSGATEHTVDFAPAPAGEVRSLRLECDGVAYDAVGDGFAEPTPMLRMLDSFQSLISKRDFRVRQRISFNRRVYRALFAEE